MKNNISSKKLFLPGILTAVIILLIFAFIFLLGTKASSFSYVEDFGLSPEINFNLDDKTFWDIDEESLKIKINPEPINIKSITSGHDSKSFDLDTSPLDGNILFVYQETLSGQSDIYKKIFSSTGAVLLDETQVESDNGIQIGVKTKFDQNGNYLIAWVDGNDNNLIKANKYDYLNQSIFTGKILGQSGSINYEFDITFDEYGNIVIAYSEGGDTQINRFDSNGDQDMSWNSGDYSVFTNQIDIGSNTVFVENLSNGKFAVVSGFNSDIGLEIFNSDGSSDSGTLIVGDELDEGRVIGIESDADNNMFILMSTSTDVGQNAFYRIIDADYNLGDFIVLSTSCIAYSLIYDGLFIPLCINLTSTTTYKYQMIDSQGTESFDSLQEIEGATGIIGRFVNSDFTQDRHLFGFNLANSSFLYQKFNDEFIPQNGEFFSESQVFSQNINISDTNVVSATLESTNDIPEGSSITYQLTNQNSSIEDKINQVSGNEFLTSNNLSSGGSFYSQSFTSTFTGQIKGIKLFLKNVSSNPFLQMNLYYNESDFRSPVGVNIEDKLAETLNYEVGEIQGEFTEYIFSFEGDVEVEQGQVYYFDILEIGGFVSTGDGYFDVRYNSQSNYNDGYMISNNVNDNLGTEVDGSDLDFVIIGLDNNLDWYTVNLGDEFVFPLEGQNLHWRVIFSTSDGIFTPRVYDLSINYETQEDSYSSVSSQLSMRRREESQSLLFNQSVMTGSGFDSMIQESYSYEVDKDESIVFSETLFKLVEINRLYTKNIDISDLSYGIYLFEININKIPERSLNDIIDISIDGVLFENQKGTNKYILPYTISSEGRKDVNIKILNNITSNIQIESVLLRSLDQDDARITNSRIWEFFLISDDKRYIYPVAFIPDILDRSNLKIMVYPGNQTLNGVVFGDGYIHIPKSEIDKYKGSKFYFVTK